MSAVITVWTKPGCVQCNAVKRKLNDAGVPFDEQDLTHPDNERDLAHFKGLGYSSAPLTEYGDILFPGFVPAEVDRVIEAWRAAQAAEVTS